MAEVAKERSRDDDEPTRNLFNQSSFVFARGKTQKQPEQVEIKELIRDQSTHKTIVAQFYATP